MKRLLVSPDCIIEDHAFLIDAVFHHAVNVLRLEIGSSVLLADGIGNEYQGKIDQIDEHKVRVSISKKINIPLYSNKQLTLIYGIARGSRTEWVLQKATELGVTSIVTTICQRSVARPKDFDKKIGRWEEIIRQAVRQSERAYIPTVDITASFAAALAKTSDADVKFIADQQGQPLQNFESDIKAKKNIVLAVGPEGGFTKEELEQAKSHCFSQVSLGPHVLRTETAAIAILAITAHLADL